MRPVIERWFWLTHLMLITVSALMVMQTTNVFTELRLSERPAGAPAQPVRGAVASPQLELERVAALTGLPATESTPEKTSAPREIRTLPHRLLGTLSNDDFAEHAMAAIEEPSTHRVRTITIDDVVDDALVIDIRRDEVLLRSGDTLLRLSSRQAADARKSRGTRELIVQLDSHNFEIDREKLSALLTSSGQQGAFLPRVVPVFKDGAAAGFKLLTIPANSPIEKLGLQIGDVITSVNNKALATPEEALGIYASLSSLHEVSLGIERGGARFTNRYALH